MGTIFGNSHKGSQDAKTLNDLLPRREAPVVDNCGVWCFRVLGFKDGLFTGGTGEEVGFLGVRFRV